MWILHTHDSVFHGASHSTCVQMSWLSRYVLVRGCDTIEVPHDRRHAMGMLRITRLREGNPPVTSVFPSRRVINVEPWCFSLLLALRNCWSNSKFANDLRGHDAHVTSSYCLLPRDGAFDLGLAVSVLLPIVTGIFVLLWFQSRLR